MNDNARTAARWIGAVAALWLGAAQAQEADRDVWLLSYEAIPSVQTTLGFDAVGWDQRAALTQAAAAALSPQIIAAAGLDPAAVVTQMTPGGYLLKTNPSLQARGAMTETEAVRLAAALGYVYRQWSVLVSRLDEASGPTGYVAVAFPEGALTPEAAQGFFEAAARADEGLGGGYTAFGDAMIFLNVRDAEHVPYSGLDDIAFAARLGQAAGAHEPPLTIAGAGYADALFVDNDWDSAAAGEDYAAAMGGDATLLSKLDALRAEHDALVAARAAEFGWR